MGFLSQLASLRSKLQTQTPVPPFSTLPPLRQTAIQQQDATDIWKGIQQQYPQLARDAYINFLNDAAIKHLNGQHYNAESYGGNGPSAINGSDPRGQIVMNRSYLGQPDATMQFLMLKELGQVESKKFLGTPQRADLFMKLLGSQNAQPNGPRYPSGLPNYGWNGDTSNMGPHQMSVGPVRTFPEDMYGYVFANALQPPQQRGEPASNGPSPQVIGQLQHYGLIPTSNGGSAPIPQSQPFHVGLGMVRK